MVATRLVPSPLCTFLFSRDVEGWVVTCFKRISTVRPSGLENTFPFLGPKSKNKDFLCKSSIKPPACVDFRERIGMHIDIQSLPRACDPLEGTRGSGIIRCRKPGILAKTELRIPYQRPIRFRPETDYPRASRSFPRITGSGNEID